MAHIPDQIKQTRLMDASGAWLPQGLVVYYSSLNAYESFQKLVVHVVGVLIDNPALLGPQ